MTSTTTGNDDGDDGGCNGNEAATSSFDKYKRERLRTQKREWGNAMLQKIRKQQY